MKISYQYSIIVFTCIVGVYSHFKFPMNDSVQIDESHTQVLNQSSSDNDKYKYNDKYNNVELDNLLLDKNLVEELNNQLDESSSVTSRAYASRSPNHSNQLGRQEDMRPINGNKATQFSDQNYWRTLYAIESSNGKMLYRRKNKARSCKWTRYPCGHHQLSVLALKDIGCNSLKCRSARENFNQSLEMSKKLEQINKKRLQKHGYKHLPNYQKYLVHQQGARGIRKILDAMNGKCRLSKRTLKLMANNSPYSYKKLRNMGSRGAARTFMNFWKQEWQLKKSITLASS